jgi:hypothetical protein
MHKHSRACFQSDTLGVAQVIRVGMGQQDGFDVVWRPANRCQQPFELRPVAGKTRINNRRRCAVDSDIPVDV